MTGHTKEDTVDIPFSSGTYTGFIKRNVATPRLLEFLHDPDGAFSDPASPIIKDSNTTSSCSVPHILEGSQESLYIKRYNYQNRLYVLKNLFRPSRAKRVWKVSQKLVACNIPTPLPISFLEQRKGRLLIKSFFISQKVDGALNLNAAFQQLQTDSSVQDTKQKKSLIHQVANMIRSLHDCGICHRDLKASNILVQGISKQAEKLYLVDLDSARIQKGVPKKGRIRDLSRLNASLFFTTGISTTDRLRFLHNYLRTSFARDKIVHTYWQAITEQTRKKLKQ
jgi:tRNA A-37 threonylcarbamoyl transferase component Bud32